MNAPIPMPDQDVGEDPAHQVLRVRPGVPDAVLPGQLDLDRRAARALERPDVVLDVALHVELADDQPADDRDQQAGRHVHERDPGPEQAPQQDEGDLVDHRAADEEGEHDPERDAGLDEADEERARPSTSRTG